MSTIQHGLKSVRETGLKVPEFGHYLVAYTAPDSVRGRANAVRMQTVLQESFDRAAAIMVTTLDGRARFLRCVGVYPDTPVIARAMDLVDTIRQHGWISIDDYRSEMQPLIQRAWEGLTMPKRLHYIELAKCGLDKLLQTTCPAELAHDLEQYAEDHVA